MRIQAYIIEQDGKKVIEGILHNALEQYDESADGCEIISVSDVSLVEEGLTYIDGSDENGFAILGRLGDYSDHHKEEERRIGELIEREKEISELKQYLDDTDYVIAKLNELKLEGDESYEAEKARYLDVLKKRKEARARLNELA